MLRLRVSLQQRLLAFVGSRGFASSAGFDPWSTSPTPTTPTSEGHHPKPNVETGRVLNSFLRSRGKVVDFPGHMRKTQRELEELLEEGRLDVVIEVRDARAPFSSGNPLLANVIKGPTRSKRKRTLPPSVSPSSPSPSSPSSSSSFDFSGFAPGRKKGNKRVQHVVVLNKSELVTTQDLEAVREHFEEQGALVVFSAAKPEPVSPRRGGDILAEDRFALEKAERLRGCRARGRGGAKSRSRLVRGRDGVKRTLEMDMHSTQHTFRLLRGNGIGDVVEICLDISRLTGFRMVGATVGLFSFLH